MATTTVPGADAHQLTSRWLELDDTIRRSNEMVREIRSERNDVATQLISVLQSQGYTKPSLRLGNQTIVLAESSRRPPLTLAMVQSAMTEAGVSEEQQRRVSDSIETQRAEGATTTIALTRRKPRRATRTRRAAVRRTENRLDQQRP
jgi:hypothetical protein